jgi:hypothetical protein
VNKIAVTHILFSSNGFEPESLALPTRAIDRTFYKKRFFVMASINWRDICDGQHRGANWRAYF